MTSSVTGRFFYPEDWERAGCKLAPCDANVAHARASLLAILESLHAGQSATSDDLVRGIDRLIEAHVADYARKHVHSVNI